MKKKDEYTGIKDAEDILEKDCSRKHYGFRVRDAIAERLRRVVSRELEKEQ